MIGVRAVSGMGIEMLMLDRGQGAQESGEECG